MLALCLERWYDEVTLRDIADRADVALQTVLNHFSSKDGVLEAMLRDPRTVEEFGGERLVAGFVNAAATAKLLVESYEHSGDAAIRFLALEARVPSLGPVLAFGRSGHREWVMRTFSSALEDLSTARRERRILQLICATDVYTWQILRRDQRLSKSRVVVVITEMIEALIRKNASTPDVAR